MGPIVDVAVGLVLIYLVLSLIATSFAELVEACLRTRAKYLWIGVGELIGNSWRTAFYKHPLICGLYRGKYENANHPLILRALPAYIPSESFAVVVIDLIAQRAAGEACPRSPRSVAVSKNCPTGS